MKDKLGFEIPQHLENTWKRADQVGRDLSRRIQTVYLEVENGVKHHDPIFAEVTQSTIEELKHIRRVLGLIIPFAVCPYDLADAVKRLGCPACHSKGYLSKFRWDRCVPKTKKTDHFNLIEGGSNEENNNAISDVA